MTNTVRYQVFISSTFTDLRDERAEVIQALLELDCIPTGMEAFLASNDSQWDIIEKVISECDYYILIIGGRYGSTTAEGISYTEKEFDYAKSLNIPILAFVHENPENIPAGKTEISAPARERLKAFREKVMDGRLVRQWNTATELGGVTSRSLIQEIKRNPRAGWVRNDENSRISLLERISLLTAENAKLRDSIKPSSKIGIPPEQLSSGRDKFVISGAVLTKTGDYTTTTSEWNVEVTWDNILINTGAILLGEASEVELRARLNRYYTLAENINKTKVVSGSSRIGDISFDAIIIQLRALGMIEKGIRKRAINDKEKYWRLTDYGDQYFVSLLAKRKAPSPDDDESKVIV